MKKNETSFQIIQEYIAKLEKALDEAGGVVPYRSGTDSEFRQAREDAAYFCGRHAPVLRDYSKKAEYTIRRTNNT